MGTETTAKNSTKISYIVVIFLLFLCQTVSFKSEKKLLRSLKSLMIILIWQQLAVFPLAQKFFFLVFKTFSFRLLIVKRFSVSAIRLNRNRFWWRRKCRCRGYCRCVSIDEFFFIYIFILCAFLFDCKCTLFLALCLSQRNQFSHM